LNHCAARQAQSVVGIEAGHSHQAFDNVKPIERIEGFSGTAAGEDDGCDCERPLPTKEIAIERDNDVGFVELPVRLDGLTKGLRSGAAVNIQVNGLVTNSPSLR
jgi:hypothetical protein